MTSLICHLHSTNIKRKLVFHMIETKLWTNQLDRNEDKMGIKQKEGHMCAKHKQGNVSITALLTENDTHLQSVSYRYCNS